MPVASIIAAVVAVAGTITSAAISSSDADDAQKEGKKLANIKREDELRRERENKRLNNAELRLRKKELGYQREAELYDRKERGLERGMISREKHSANMMNLVNSNEVLKSNFLNIFQRRGA